MTCQEQLDEWVKGNSLHNHERGECCPDFSCCKPELAISLEQRILFRDSSEDVRMEMLGMFLGAALDLAFSEKGKKGSVYIAGLNVDAQVH